MANLYKQFLDLMPDRALQVGDVTAITDGLAVVQLPGGGQLRARGEATVGQRVFVRDGVIEGLAPNLPVVSIEV